MRGLSALELQISIFQDQLTHELPLPLSEITDRLQQRAKALQKD